MEDDHGPVNIPSQTSFYTMIIDHNLFISSSRRDAMTNTIKAVDLH